MREDRGGLRRNPCVSIPSHLLHQGRGPGGHRLCRGKAIPAHRGEVDAAVATEGPQADSEVREWQDLVPDLRLDARRVRLGRAGRRDDVRQGDGDRATAETDAGHSTTTKAHSHVPAFLREAVQASAQQLEVPENFDFAAARIALINAAINARSCPGSNLRGKAIVTFDPSGQARAVDIPLLIGDGADRDCIARTFKGVHVPRFTGGAVAVKKDF